MKTLQPLRHLCRKHQKGPRAHPRGPQLPLQLLEKFWRKESEFLLPLESPISVALFSHQLVLVPSMLGTCPQRLQELKRSSVRMEGHGPEAAWQHSDKWETRGASGWCTSKEEAGGGWSELRLLYPRTPCGPDCPHTSRLVVLKDSEFSDALR